MVSVAAELTGFNLNGILDKVSFLRGCFIPWQETRLLSQSDDRSGLPERGRGSRVCRGCKVQRGVQGQGPAVFLWSPSEAFRGHAPWRTQGGHPCERSSPLPQLPVSTFLTLALLGVQHKTTSVAMLKQKEDATLPFCSWRYFKSSRPKATHQEAHSLTCLTSAAGRRFYGHWWPDRRCEPFGSFQTRLSLQGRGVECQADELDRVSITVPGYSE